MPLIDFIPPAPESARSPERGSSAPPHSPKTGAEQFDTIMGRALAHSSRKSADDSDSPDEAPRGDKYVSRTKQSESDAAAPMDAAAAAAATAPTAPPPDRNDTSALPPPPAEAPAGTAPVAASQAPGTNAAQNAGGADQVIANEESAAAESGLADELAALSGNDPPQTAAEPAPSAAAPPNEATSGISGAKQQQPMQQAENTNEFSGSTEQKLPAAETVHAGAEVSARVGRPANFKMREEKSEASTATPASLTSPATTNAPGSAAAVSTDWPLPVRSVERTQDLMALHAMRLRDSGSDSLQVVIKPDAGLQLSLNLQMRNGSMEMSAQMNRGNFDLLNLHWPELQQQLEARGIKLAPLTNEHAATQNGGHSSQHSGRHSSEDRNRPGAFAEFALNSTLVPPPAAKSRTRVPRGWESWA